MRRVLGPELVDGIVRLQAVDAAVEHVHPAGAGEVSLDGLEGHADGQVVPAVAVEVSRGEAEPELFVAVGRVQDVWGVLVPELVVGSVGLQSMRPPIQHVHRSRVQDVVRTTVEVLQPDPDGEVVVPVGVEVPERQVVAEVVPLLIRVLHMGTVLVPELGRRRDSL